MDDFVISALYAETCKRWGIQPRNDELSRWVNSLGSITEEEARQVIENHAKGPWAHRMPYAGTIYKEAMKLRTSKPVQSSSLSSGNPYPDKDTDNRHFLEWMAFVEGKTPEEMDRYIDEFMTEWEKKGKQ